MITQQYATLICACLQSPTISFLETIQASCIMPEHYQLAEMLGAYGTIPIVYPSFLDEA